MTPLRATADAAAMARRALSEIARRLPALSYWLGRVRVSFSGSAQTAQVSQCGKISLNPPWFSSLGEEAAIFVLAHELMHLQLRSHERAEGSDAVQFNIAHDAVINDTLSFLLGAPVPAGGICYPGARHSSAEALLRHVPPQPGPHWTPLGGAREVGYESDLLPLDTRHGHFGKGSGSWSSFEVEVEDFALPMTSLRGSDLVEGWGYHRIDNVISARMTGSTPPWSAVAERWAQEGDTPLRTFARASRRGNHEFVSAGRLRRGAILQAMLDTSTSMLCHIGPALGSLLAFCQAAAIDSVHLIMASHGAAEARLLAPHDLESLRVVGSADEELLVQPEACSSCKVRHAVRLSDAQPTDLREGFALATSEPSAQPLLVLTDGAIRLPEVNPPFPVLWAIFGSAPPPSLPFGEIFPAI